VSFLVTALAGAFGALCRYLISGVVQERSQADFPVGTLAVNLAGALLIGLLVGDTHLASAASIAAVGFLGGFTTFSTWMIETIRLGMPTLRARAMANLTLTFIAGVALTAAGYSLTN
jgi:CrcB protein